jgi:hypothetical protein
LPTLSGRLCDVPATILDGKATAAAIRRNVVPAAERTAPPSGRP